jgi:hypothetical protein
MERYMMIVSLLGASEDCPYGNHLENCPAKAIRKRFDLKETYHYIRSLDQNKLEALYETHRECAKCREVLSSINRL